MWMVVYVPAYALAYPATNFLFLCNLGVTLTALAIFVGNRLVVSSQAVAAPIIGLVWALDAGTRVTTGSFLFGGTAYMWDPQYPLFTRLLSLYHLGWPVLVVWCLVQTGYDRRGWALQSGIAGSGIVLARLATDPAENVNFAFRDPFWGQQLGPPVLHLVIVVGAMSVVAYGMTHVILIRALRPATSPGLADASLELGG